MKQKKICAVYEEGAVTDRTCKSGLRSFVLEISRWMMLYGWSRPVEVVSAQTGTLRTINIHHLWGSWHTKNIHINKGIGENEKYVFYFMENTIRTFLANAILFPKMCYLDNRWHMRPFEVVYSEY